MDLKNLKKIYNSMKNTKVKKNEQTNKFEVVYLVK